MSRLKNQPLSNHQIYDGHDVDDAREVLSRLFTQIAMEPLDTKTPLRIQVNGIELPRIAICYINFESGAVTGPVNPLDFHTLQLNPTGNAAYKTNDGVVAGSSRKGVMLSAGQTVRNHHSEANGNLALIVKDKVMRDYLSMWTGKEQSPSLKFKPEFDLDNPRVASFLGLADRFVEELNRPGGILEIPAAVASFEHALLTSLLFGLEHNWSDTLEPKESLAGTEQIRRIEEYIEAHATRPIDIATISQASGLSGSTIHRLFNKHRDYTPMQFLQETRMTLARQRLMLGLPSDSVTRIAMECGFIHLGRFASGYRQRFGESPSQTLQRATKQLTTL